MFIGLITLILIALLVAAFLENVAVGGIGFAVLLILLILLLIGRV